MPVTWVLAFALLLVLVFAFRLLFYALHFAYWRGLRASEAGVLLRNLMAAVEAQGLDDKDMERLHAAMQDARRFFQP